MATEFAQKLIFLVGPPRSGTTWLQLMIYQCPVFASCQETHLFSAYFQKLFSTWEGHREITRGTGINSYISEDRYFGLIRTLALEILSEIVNKGERRHATFFLEKTPHHVSNHREILKLFPEAKFLELVRDPRAMVASMRAVAADWGKWAAPGIVENALLWRTAIRDGQTLARTTPNHLRVRYEDIKSRPAEELSRILRWIGVAPSASEVEKYVNATAIDRLRDQRDQVHSPWDMSKEPRHFYRRGLVDSWKQELSRSETRLIEHICWDEMGSLGYVPVGLRRRVSSRYELYKLIQGLQWRLPRLAARL